VNTKTTSLGRVPLGKTGIEVSPLAIGTGTHGWSGSSDQTRKGRDWLVEHFRASYELRVNFWDLADQYGSHDFARRALSGIPREQIVINTKTTASGEAECERAIDRFLEELGSDYVDSVLLHGVTNEKWPRTHSGAMKALARAKEAGKVRAAGISSHGIGALRTAAAEPWVDLILVRLNHAGVNMDATPDIVVPVLEQAHEAGKGIYAMKVLGCGALADDPKKAIRWVADLDCVDAMTIGFAGEEQLRFAVGLLR
jgi:aryl-alcohol dehydrogenase-like predicted oxidoreductase